MQAQLLVGPIAPINGSDALSSLFKTGLLISTSHRRRSRSAVSSTAAINGEENYYAVLGVAHGATSADIKKAYRLLARKVALVIVRVCSCVWLVRKYEETNSNSASALAFF